MRGYKKSGLVLGLALMAVASPANAAMACWDQTHSAAAKVRDLQSRLMVSALRCRAMGIDILPAYNAFVAANRPTIQAANGVIKAQFVSGMGEKSAQSEYDSFTTALANAYGGAATSLESCEADAAVANEAVAANGDIAALVDIADRTGAAPALPGGECPITFASLAPN